MTRMPELPSTSIVFAAADGRRVLVDAEPQAELADGVEGDQRAADAAALQEMLVDQAAAEKAQAVGEAHALGFGAGVGLEGGAGS